MKIQVTFEIDVDEDTWRAYFAPGKPGSRGLEEPTADVVRQLCANWLDDELGALAGVLVL